MTTLLESVRTFLLTYSGLDADAGFLVEQLSGEATQYALVPLSGDPIIERYINGVTLRQFPFAVQSLESTADDLARIAASGFYENLSNWLEVQNESGSLPDLDATENGETRTAESIEPVGLPILLEFGESGTGVYQLQCRMTYTQNAI